MKTGTRDGEGMRPRPSGAPGLGLVAGDSKGCPSCPRGPVVVGPSGPHGEEWESAAPYRCLGLLPSLGEIWRFRFPVGSFLLSHP